MGEETLRESETQVRTIYLLHFDRPYKHARHYLGSAKDLEARLESHRTGKGGHRPARLMTVVREAGIGFVVARTWQGSRKREKQLKPNRARACPLCNPGLRPTSCDKRAVK